MAKTRKQLQEQRNKAGVAQRQAKNASGIGSPAHRKAIATTKSLGAKMKARVKANDKSKADFVITVKNVDEYVDSKGKLKKKVSISPGGTKTTTTTPSGTKIPVWKEGVRTRMGYDPDGMIDYTNANPAYWTSVLSYYKAHPNGNSTTGELGIWIPNFEKQGAESTALAAIAGGVRAYTNSNYANRTVTDEGRAVRVNGSLTAKGSKSYRGTTKEKAIRLNSISRGGTDVKTDRPMGGTDPIGYGAEILGGKVIKGAMPGYLKDGGDYGGLLGKGTSITGDMLTRLLGGMDKDGMRLRGTFPAVAGATGSGIGVGGTKTSVGGLYAGGVDPIAGMPKVADYTAYMDPNSIFGGLSKNAAVKSGLLYQPMASDYGAKMEAAGMPAFSPGLLSGGGGVGSVTYGSPASGFMKPKATITTSGGGTKIPIGSTTTAPGRRYAYPTDRPLYGGGMSKDIPTFASLDALSSMYSDLGSYGTKYPGAKGTAKIGGGLYTFDGVDGWTPSGFSYPLVTTTA